MCRCRGGESQYFIMKLRIIYLYSKGSKKYVTFMVFDVSNLYGDKTCSRILHFLENIKIMPPILIIFCTVFTFYFLTKDKMRTMSHHW